VSRTVEASTERLTSLVALVFASGWSLSSAHRNKRWHHGEMATTPDDAVEARCPACGRRNRVPNSAAGSPRCGHCHAPLPWLVAAGDATFDAVATKARLPVLVDLWAPWCGPCRMVGPAVERLATDLAGRLKVVKVNVDEAPSVAARFDAMSIPTLLLLSDGQTVDRIVGALPAKELGIRVRAALDRLQRPD